MEKEKITKQLGIHSLFKSISNSFINLFIPLIVYNQLGYKMAILYLILTSIATILAAVLFSKLIKNNPVFAIIIHIVLAIGAYMFIMLCKINLIVVICVAMFSGISHGLYYTAVNAIISANKSAKGFTNFKVWQFIGSLIMVLFNGYILSNNSSVSVLITALISLILYIISIIPFLTVIKHLNLNTNYNVGIKRVLEYTKPYNIFNVLFGIHDFIIVSIVPLYLAINNLSVDKIAIIVAIINFIKILLTILANELYNKNKSLLAISIGAVVYGISSLIMVICYNNVIVYIMSVLGGIVFPLFYIPTLNEYQEQIKGADAEGMIIREVCIYGLRPFLLLPFLFVENLAWLIGFGVIISVLMIISASKIFKN